MFDFSVATVESRHVTTKNQTCPYFSGDAVEDVGDDGRAGSTDVLHERALGAADLIRAGALAELEVRLHELIATRRAHRVAAGLEPAERRERQVAVETDPAFGRELRTAAERCEARRFESQRAHDRVGVV